MKLFKIILPITMLLAEISASGRTFVIEQVFLKMENEIWKDVVGYEGLYQVSNLGRVKALSCKKYRGRFLQNRPEIILITKACFNSYNKVTVYKNGKGRTTSNHILVAKAFIYNPENKPVVNHINGIKTDNRVENLEWVTFKENTNHADRIGLRKIYGEFSKVSKLKDEDVIYIRENYVSDLKHQTSNTKELCEKFNIAKTTLHKLLRRQSYKHL